MSKSQVAQALEEHPENVMTLEEVTNALLETEARFMRLYRRFHELNGTTDTDDKRSQFNPIRNLKIAAFRSYEWAKGEKCDAAEARDRAIAAAFKRAQEFYPACIADGALPAGVMAYIDLTYSEYNMTEEEKKASRKAAAKEKKAKKKHAKN